MKNDFFPYLDLNAFVSYKFYGLRLNLDLDLNIHSGATEASSAKQASKRNGSQHNTHSRYVKILFKAQNFKR